jgi:oligopeptide/dipeptide ABC transporter ATP-binding protein
MLGHRVNESEPRVRLLELTGVNKTYRAKRGLFGGAKAPYRALNNVTLTVYRQEVLGLVGESGCGKSTLAHVAIRLLDVDGGSVAWNGNSVTGLSARSMRTLRQGVQMVFQDTGSSLNPRKTVERHLFETLAIAGTPRAERQARAHQLLGMVGLDPAVEKRLPHQLSGGQRQRLGIARALAMKPELIIADEPVASLDVSLQAQIINLLDRLRRELGLAMLFISHDLALVARISDRVAVMFAGAIVEEGRPQQILSAPAHPYTRALLDAIPRGIEGRERPRKVQAEAAALPGTGCRFAPRCPLAEDVCRTTEPEPLKVTGGHFARCHFAGRVTAGDPVSVPTVSAVP